MPKRQLLGALIAYAFAGSTFANPVGPAVVNGSANFATTGRTLTVTNTPNAIINWRAFSIGAGETTRFVQQSATSAVLNRVVGQDPSAILGTLSSNGRVFLLNPNGIVFGAGSRVDVAGLVASTLNLSNQDFLAGRLNFEAGATANSVVNYGNIVTPAGGRVYLIAPNIENHGVISTPQGQTILAAGKSVQLVEADVPNLRVEIQSGGEALNVGQILADGGSAGIYAGLINQKGIVRADSISRDATGKIVFRASGRTMLEGGSVTSASGEQGGRIEITGEEVGLVGNARVEATGRKGGGTILVGGDYQGKNPDVPNARAIYMGPDAVIDASATQSGDGGKVVVWSNERTGYYGSISSRGSSQGGNGGFVETSGKQTLVAEGTVDASAPKGRGGQWLLDPWNVTVSNNADANPGGWGGTFNATGTGSNVNAGTIQSALNGGTSVTVTTGSTGGETGDITIYGTANPGGAVNISKTSGSATTLKFQAAGSILMNTGASITSTSGNSLGVTLNAGNNNGVTTGSGAIVLNGANIQVFDGDIIFGGGTNPLTGAAVGTLATPIGVQITSSIVANFGTTGSTTINGQGRTASDAGVQIQDSGVSTVGSMTINATGNLNVLSVAGQSALDATGTGLQTVIATGLNLQAGASGSAIIRGGGSQSISVGSGGILLSAGEGTNRQATITKLGTSGTQTVTTTGTLTLLGGGTVGSGSGNQATILQNGSDLQHVAANGILIQAGGGATGANDYAAILTATGSTASQQVDVGSGGLALLGGTGTGGTNKAGVWVLADNSVNSNTNATQVVNVTGGGIQLTGGSNVLAVGGNDNGASIFAAAQGPSGSQTVAVTGSGSIILTGGTSGNANSGGIQSNTPTQNVVVGSGGIVLNGGGGAIGASNTGRIFQQKATGSQSITVNGGGSIIATGGSGSGGSNAAQIVSSGTGLQSILFTALGSTINLTGGTGSIVGTATGGNIASIDTSLGNQTIEGSVPANNPAISVTGGPSGGNTSLSATNLGNNAYIRAGVGSQGIAAGSIQVNGGAGGVDNSGTIQAPDQTITASSVVIAGSGSSGSFGGARIGGIGGATPGPTNLSLTTTGNITVSGGSVPGASIGANPLGGVTTDITINSGGNVTLNAGAGNGAFIGSPSAAMAGGNISITAGGNIALNSAGGIGTAINTTGDVILHADAVGGTISQGINSVIRSTGLLATATSGINLPGNNLVTHLNATNTTSGGIQFTQAAGNALTVTSIGQSGGNVVITADDLDISGVVNAGANTVTLRPTTLSRNIVFEEGHVTGGVLNLSVADIANVTSGVLEVGRSDNTGTGDMTVSSFINTAFTPDANAGTVKLFAKNINFSSASVGGVGTPFDHNFEARATDNLTVSNGISLADGRNLVLAADNDANGAGDMLLNRTVGPGAITVGASGVNTGSMTLSGQNITVSGNPFLSVVWVRGTGTQTITAANAVQVLGGSGTSGGAQLQTEFGFQNVSANSILVQGGAVGTGNSAFLISGGAQTLTAGAGGIAVVGGGGTSSNAQIWSTGTQNIATGVGGITITGGVSGMGNGAAIQQMDAASDQTIVVNNGGNVNLTGGGGTQNWAQLSNGGQVQSVSFTAGGALNLQGGAGAGGQNSANLQNNTANATVQSVNFAGGGAINITGGSVGNENRAEINRNAGTLTITGTPSITLLGGASGGAIGASNEGSITAQSAAGATTIAANNLTITGGAGLEASGGIFPSAALLSITYTGSVQISGGSGPGAIAGIASQEHDLNLNLTGLPGSGGVTLTGGTGGVSSGFPASAVIGTVGGVNANVTIDSQGGITLNRGGSGAGPGEAFIGADTGGGTINLNAGLGGAGNLNLNNGFVGTTGNTTLQAGNGQINQTSGGVKGALLSASSLTGTALGGANTVNSFNAANSTSGAITLNNAASTLTLAGITQSGGGAVSVTNAGSIATSAAIVSNGDVTLTATGASSNLLVSNNISGTGVAGKILLLQADNNIIFNSPGGVGTTNALNVTLGSDRDVSGGGNIQLGAGTAINSNGGNIVMGGGITPPTGYAQGAGATQASSSGIYIAGDINAGAGNVTMRGKGATGFLPADGVALVGGTLSSNGIVTIDGIAQASHANGGCVGVCDFVAGVHFAGPGVRLTTATGTVNVTGINTTAGVRTQGITVDGATIETTGTGTLTLNGTSTPLPDTNWGVGILFGGTVRTTAAGGGALTIIGSASPADGGLVLLNGNVISGGGEIRMQSQAGSLALAGSSTVGGAGSGNVLLKVSDGSPIAVLDTAAVNAGASALTLSLSGGTASDSNNSITAGSLRLLGTGNFNFGGTGHDVGTIAANITGASSTLNYRDSNALLVGSVTSFDGVSSTSTAGITLGTAGANTVSLNAGNDISFAPGITVTAGSLNLAGSGNALFNSGTVTLNTSVTADIPVNIGGATVDFNGPLADINNGLSFSSGTRQGTGAVAVNSGSFTWSGGVIQGGGTTTVSPGAGLAISGSPVLISSTLDNQSATGQWTGNGTILLHSGGTLVNTGTLTATGDGSISRFNTGVFTNNGLFEKNGGTGTTTIQDSGTTLTNSSTGTIRVTTGTLNLSSTFNNHGLVDVAAGKTLNINGSGAGGGDYVIGALGQVNLSSGTQTFNTTGGAPSITGAGLFNVNGSGTMFVSTPLAVANLQLSGGTPRDGAAMLTVSGGLTWSGGVIQGGGLTQVQPGAGLTISGSPTLIGSTLINQSTTGQWTGNGTILLHSGGTLHNSGTLTATGDGTIDRFNTGVFNNLGLFEKNGGTGTTTIQDSGTALSNTGTIRVTTGTLNLSSTFLNQGLVDVAAGKTLNINGSGGGGGDYVIGALGQVNLSSGTQTFNTAGGSPSITGAGLFNVNGSGVMYVSTPLAVDNLQLSGGFRDGPAALTVSGGLTWSGGVIQGGGMTTVLPGAGLTISGSPMLISSTLDNQSATAQWTGNGTILLHSGGTLLNNGTLTATGDGTINRFNTGVFTNNGLFEKNGGTGTTTIQDSGTTLTNSGTGTIRVTTGTLDVSAALIQDGTIDVATGATFRRGGGFANSATGTILGGGTIDLVGGTLINDGVIRPGGAGTVGTLSITGNYMQGAGGALETDLAGAGAGQYDVLAVSGSATLDGALNRSYLAYTPAIGDTLDVLTYGSRSGIFSSGTDANSLVPLFGGTALSLLKASGTQNIWVLSGGGSWSTAANWSLAHVPISTEEALVADLSGAPTLTVTGAPPTVGSIRFLGNETLRVDSALTVSGSTQLNAGGTLTPFLGGTFTTNGAATVSNLNLNSGTVNGTGSLTVTNSFTGFGTVNIGGNASITQAVGNLTSNGSITASQISIAATAGSILWGPGGVISAGAGGLALSAGGATGDVVLGGGGGVFASSTGLTTVTAGRDLKVDGTVSTATLQGASMNVNVARDVILIGGVGGAYVKSTAGAQTILAGRDITLTGGTAGTFVDAFIQASGGLQTIAAGGTIALTGGVGGDNNFATIEADAGQLVSAAAIQLTGGTGAGPTGNWAEIEQFGLGLIQSVTVAGGGTLSIQGGTGNGNNAHIENLGTVQTINFPSGGTLQLTGGSGGSGNRAAITAFNTQIIQGSAGITNAPAITVQGAGIGNEAAIEVAAGSQTLYATGMTLSGGTGVLSGSGTVSLGGGTLTNNGVIRPGGAGTIGTLNVNGNYSQGAGGTLDMDVSGASTYDKLVISGTANLGGTLLVTPVSYSPASGDQYNLLTYSGLPTGTFGTITAPAFTGATPDYATSGNFFFNMPVSTINTWNFDGSDSWLNTARWSLGHVPLNTEDVIIPDYSTLFTVTIPSGPQVVKSIVLQGNDIFAVNGGSFTFTSASTMTNAALSVGGGTVTANGSLAVKDLTLSSGALNGSGNVNISNSLNWSGGSLGGTGTVTTGAAATSTLSGGTKTLTGIWQNSGIASWTGGHIDLSAAGAVLRNASGGQFNANITATGDDILGGSGLFLNQAGATFTVPAASPAGDITMLAAFQNDGTVNINSTNLDLHANGVHAGAFTIASGAALRFRDSASNVFSGASSVTGAGLVEAFNTPSTNFNGTYSVGSTIASGGTINMNSAGASTTTLNATGGALSVQGGTFTISGLSTVGAGGALTLSGGNLVPAALDNGGQVNVSAGALSLPAGGTHTGAFSVNAGATLNFSGGTHNINPGATFAGAGTVGLTTGSLNLATPVSVGNFSMSGGTFSGVGILTVNGAFNYMAGSINGTLDLAGSSNSFLNGVSVAGTGQIDNLGALTLQNASIAPALINDGALTVLAGVNTVASIDNNGLVLLNAGSLSTPATYLQYGGLTLIQGGAALNVPAGMVLNGGSLMGNGVVTGNVNNVSGTLAAGASVGALTINGNYTQGPGGTMQVEFSGSSSGQYDVLNVTGTASIDGTLALVSLPGAIVVPGSPMGFLSAGSLSGTFATILQPPLGSFSLAYTPTGIDLSGSLITTPPPVPPPPSQVLPQTQTQSNSLPASDQDSDPQTGTTLDSSTGSSGSTAPADDTSGRKKRVPTCG